MVIRDLNGLAAYVQVVEAGGFTAAADALGVSKSAISRQIKALEEELGVRLLNRTTRRLSPTEAGTAVYQHARRMIEEAEAAREVAVCIQGAMRGTLRVNAPMTFGIRELGPVLPEFMKRYPDVTIDLVLNDRRVDLVEEGFDVSVRISTMVDSSMIVRQLAPVRRLIAGTPDYFSRHPIPAHPRELSEHQFMIYTLSTRPTVLSFSGLRGERIEVPVSGSLHCNNGDAMEAAVMAGLGLVVAPDFIHHAHMRAGRLVSVLDGWSLPAITLHALYPPGKNLLPKVRAFVDFLGEKFGPSNAPWVGPLIG